MYLCLITLKFPTYTATVLRVEGWAGASQSGVL